MHSALRRAIEHGNLDAVHAALEHGADIEETDMHGDRGLPLRIACFKGHTAIVEELIRRGADINARNAEGSGGPIRMATKGRHREIVDMLLLNGADIPDGIELALYDQGERRARADRRKRNAGPPSGFRERRQHSERRVTSVKEVTLTEWQWDSYFSPSQIERLVVHDHEHFDPAALILDRARD
jgi:hypothetical protein